MGSFIITGQIFGCRLKQNILKVEKIQKRWLPKWSTIVSACYNLHEKAASAPRKNKQNVLRYCCNFYYISSTILKSA